MSTSEECKDTASQSNNDDDVCDVKIKLQNLSMADLSVCANCGKEGDDVNNKCNKCKKATYCNAACKKKHRHKHKKQCEEHVRLAVEKHDQELFKQPPVAEDCPICFLRIPSLHPGYRYRTCCGKVICSGCIHSPVYDGQGNEVDNEKCPFCRLPTPNTDEEAKERLKKRVEAEDPNAIFNLGCYYRDGKYGLPQDNNKSLELWHQAAKLGHIEAYGCIGYTYHNGYGVEIDKKRAKHYYELGAIGGDVNARYNLGLMEEDSGNMKRALRHYIIAAGSGQINSLKQIRILYTNGHATIDDDTKALRSYEEYLFEIKSRKRDKAAAFHEEYRYY